MKKYMYNIENKNNIYQNDHPAINFSSYVKPFNYMRIENHFEIKAWSDSLKF